MAWNRWILCKILNHQSNIICCYFVAILGSPTMENLPVNSIELESHTHAYFLIVQHHQIKHDRKKGLWYWLVPDLEVNPWTWTPISADIGTFGLPLLTYVLIETQLKGLRITISYTASVLLIGFILKLILVEEILVPQNAL